MNVISKKMTDIYPAEKNVRKHPQKQIEELKRSYEKFGQYRPLVISHEGEILVGNGLYEAMKLANAEKVDVIQLPKDTPEDYKIKLMLADNKTFALGADNIQNIDEILSTIGDFDIPGYDANILEEMYKEIEDIKVNIDDISGMGIIPEEKVKEINNVAEHRAENENYGVPKNKDNITSKYEAVEEIIPSNNQENESTRYVNCPHCGAKVWI